MVQAYMVEFDLPDSLTDEIMSVIPRHREHVDRLLGEGIIQHYSLAIDRSKLWVVIVANSEEEVGEIIADFPLIDYMTPKIHTLMFSNSHSDIPMINLN